MDILKLIEVCRNNDYEALENVLKDEPDACLSGSFFYSMPPGFWIDAPLNVAAKKHSRECIKILLKYGADPDRPSKNRDGTQGKSAREIAPDLFQ